MITSARTPRVRLRERRAGGLQRTSTNALSTAKAVGTVVRPRWSRPARAQTTVYDNRFVASVSTQNAAMLGVDVATTILRGDPTLPLIGTAVERLAAAGPFERCAPESADHRCARRSSGRD
jgi:hypothetical protein